MARYTDAVCKLCRREGEKLFLKGDRCFSPKCAFERRPTPPGPVRRFRAKESDYGNQLREKQKVRRIYGIFERQFRRYFKKAQQMKGVTGTNLLIILESRLDNVVFRLGLADSRSQARQLVRHGHIAVNGRKTNIPSFLAKPGDTITVRDKSGSNGYFKLRAQTITDAKVPAWLKLDTASLTGTVLAVPTREDIDFTLNEQLIVEYYSR
ncbi:MAG: 30S ribosomal protein S4 [Anaerolineae bacterium]